MKRIFVVHGWYGHPGEGWFPWLKETLEARGFEVFVPAMPDPAHPRIESWVRQLAGEVGELDQETFFVGHSIGCQTILRYLQMGDARAGGVVCVAPWTTL